MPESRTELPYKMRKWPMILSLPVMAVGVVGGVVGGIYFYNGGDFTFQDITLRGKSGAAILWCWAGAAALCEIAIMAFWVQIARRRPAVLLEPDAIIVPSKWRMLPIRIPIATITRYDRRISGNIKCLWLYHQSGKTSIVEDILEPGAAQLIVDWIDAHRPGGAQETAPHERPMVR